MKEMLDRICQSVVDLEIDKMRSLVQETLATGVPPYQIIVDGMSKGMEIVGQKFSAQEYFLSELLAAGEAMKEGMDVLTPLLEGAHVQAIGKVVLGTVRGDIHDIGKDIVKMLLTGARFEVFDLGVDVETSAFVEKVKETNAHILAMSALLTTTMGEMRSVVDEMKQAGVRNKVKVVIGGAPITPEFGKEIGADFAAMDAPQGVQIAIQWIKEQQNG
jgi:5-methyltetrahydrofolate--homocysteine methyltransferase